MSTRLALPLLASLVLGAGCSRCAPPPPPPPQASPFDAGERLTEADTDRPVDRTVSGADGGQWTLRVPQDDWRVVKEAPTRRLMPEVDRWLVNPVLDAHATVRCDATPLGKAELSTFRPVVEARVAALRRSFVLQSSTAVDGPWLDGLDLVYQTRAGPTSWQYVHRAVAQLERVCEVQAWSKPSPTVLEELKQLVASFVPTATPADRAVNDVFRTLKEPRVKAGLAAFADAGVSPNFLGLVIVGEGIARLPDELVDERFRLRLALLERSPDDVCGGLIRQLQDPQLLIAALDTFSEEEADRWATIGRAAILAQVDGAKPPLPDDKAVEAARRALVSSHPDMASALAALKAVDRHADGEICDAERARLEQALKLDLKTRVTLFRDWLGR